MKIRRDTFDAVMATEIAILLISMLFAGLANVLSGDLSVIMFLKVTGAMIVFAHFLILCFAAAAWAFELWMRRNER